METVLYFLVSPLLAAEAAELGEVAVVVVQLAQEVAEHMVQAEVAATILALVILLVLVEHLELLVKEIMVA
jgi:hypothetical protein